MTHQEILDLINANLASGSKIQAVKHREVEKALLDFSNQNSAQQYDIKAIYANSTYLGNNFESNGLGKNLRAGWAICNGNNGTPPMQGRTIVNYGGDFPTLNAVGGSKDAVVVAHNHAMGDQSGSSGSGTTNIRYLGREIESNSLGIPYTDFSGESGVGKNMQPYIVLVYIMKL